MLFGALVFSLACFSESGSHSIHRDSPKHQGSSGSASQLEKPALLYFSSFKDKSEDPGIARSRQLEVSRLAECGFDVRDVEVQNIDTMKNQLKSGNFAPDTPVFVSASHGSPRSSSKGFSELRIDPMGYDVSAPGLIEAIRTIAPKSSVYLDVCHAGLCRDGKCERLGTACSSQEKSMFEEYRDSESKSKFPVAQEMIDLYCDSINSCSEIKKGDKNKDGILDGKEINEYLADKFASSTGAKKKYAATEHQFNSWKDAQAEQKNCEAQEKTFTCTENIKALDLKHSIKSKKGWRRAAEELEPAFSRRLQPQPDIPTATRDEVDYPGRFSGPMQSFLDGRWPEPSDPEAVSAVRGVTHTQFQESGSAPPYQISIEGKEIFGKDKYGDDFRYRLDEVSPKPGQPLISCKCVSHDAVPSAPNHSGSQQAYFDPSFQLPCRAKSSAK